VSFQGCSEKFARTVAEAIAGMNRVVARRILPSPSGVAEQLNQGGAILEVGCKTGNLLLQLAQVFPHSRCTDVDIDPTGLAAARTAVYAIFVPRSGTLDWPLVCWTWVSSSAFERGA
jgi:ubiquinone/menaquinone biosynthesis C-methylase UbiE